MSKWDGFYQVPVLHSRSICCQGGTLQSWSYSIFNLSCLCVFEGSESCSRISSSWRWEERLSPGPLLGSRNGCVICIVCLQRQVAFLSVVTQTVNYRFNSSLGCLRQSLYSSTEASFANGWVSMAQYVAAVHFQFPVWKIPSCSTKTCQVMFWRHVPTAPSVCVFLFCLLMFLFCLSHLRRMIKPPISLTWVRRRTILSVSSIKMCPVKNIYWILRQIVPPSGHMSRNLWEKHGGQRCRGVLMQRAFWRAHNNL